MAQKPLVCCRCHVVAPPLLLRGSQTCRTCGSTELVPPGTPRAEEILGLAHDEEVRAATAAAAAAAAALGGNSPHLRQGSSPARRATFAALVLALVAAGSAGWVAKERWLERRAAAKAAKVREADASRSARPAVAVPDRVLDEKLAPYVPPKEERVRVREGGLARAAPSAKSEPVMRTTAGETYVVAERAGGWVKLGGVPVDAWLPETAVESAPDP